MLNFDQLWRAAYHPKKKTLWKPRKQVGAPASLKVSARKKLVKQFSSPDLSNMGLRICRISGPSNCAILLCKRFDLPSHFHSRPVKNLFFFCHRAYHKLQYVSPRLASLLFECAFLRTRCGYVVNLICGIAPSVCYDSLRLNNDDTKPSRTSSKPHPSSPIPASKPQGSPGSSRESACPRERCVALMRYVFVSMEAWHWNYDHTDPFAPSTTKPKWRVG